MVDEATLEQYRSQDWVEIAAKVTNFACRKARIYGWIPGGLMPRGQEPEDLAYEAIAEFWQSPDRFKPRLAITTWLCGVVKHKLWNLYRREEAKTTEREKGITGFEAADKAKAPDVEVSERDGFDRAIRIMLEHPRIKGSEDHELVVTAMGCRILDAEELEKETRLPRTRIYQVRREIGEIYPDIKKQLLKN